MDHLGVLFTFFRMALMFLAQVVRGLSVLEQYIALPNPLYRLIPITVDFCTLRGFIASKCPLLHNITQLQPHVYS